MTVSPTARRYWRRWRRRSVGGCERALPFCCASNAFLLEDTALPCGLPKVLAGVLAKLAKDYATWHSGDPS